MSEVKSANENADPPPVQEGAPVEVSKAVKPRAIQKRTAGHGGPLYYTVEAAAAKLSLDPAALRARLRRAQRVEGDMIVADLGGGIRGFKFGKSWRIRFPEG
jgi:hypothetical protein